jgi:hypothetical protein
MFRAPGARGRGRPWRNLALVSPTWIWMQAAVVVFVLAGAIIAIVKLA